jgi:hypothetical protein
VRCDESHPGTGCYRKDSEGIEFSVYLKSKGFNVIPLSRKEQLEYGCNSINLGNGRIVACNQYARCLLRIQPTHLETFPCAPPNCRTVGGEELTRGWVGGSQRGVAQHHPVRAVHGQHRGGGVRFHHSHVRRAALLHAGKASASAASLEGNLEYSERRVRSSVKKCTADLTSP